jgi:hypothetical protein
MPQLYRIFKTADYLSYSEREYLVVALREKEYSEKNSGKGFGGNVCMGCVHIQRYSGSGREAMIKIAQ